MKAILTLVSLTILFLTGCVSGGSYETQGRPTLSYYGGYVSSGYSYPMRPYQHQHQTYNVGPQYYRATGVPCGVRVQNYTNAPIVVNRPHGSREIIPRSWDCR